MKASKILGVILLLGIFCWFVFAGYCVYKGIEIKYNDCLIEIAEEYCEQQGEFYDSLSWNFDPYFSCKESFRDRNSDGVYEFLEEELERCGE